MTSNTPFDLSLNGGITNGSEVDTYGKINIVAKNTANDQVIISGYEAIKTTKIMIKKNYNDTIFFKAYDNGVYSKDASNNISIIIPTDPNTGIMNYSRNVLLDTINKSIANINRYGIKIKTTFGIYQINGIDYIKIRNCINKTYSALDYRLVFYDPYSFVKCFVGVSSVRNTSWDSTLGWLLGYRLNTVSNLNDDTLFGYSINNNIVSLTGDTGVSTNLYNYFMICLDDYNQNHLNDGLITVTTKDTDIPLPSYANRSSFVCNPVTGKKQYNTNIDSDNKRLTQSQIYSINSIANSRSDILASGNTINSKTSATIYGLGPYVKDVFGLIPMKVAGLQNGSYFVEFGGTLQNQDRLYFGPVNIQRMTVKLVSDKGDVVDLNNANWSFSLMVESLSKLKPDSSKK